MTGGDAQPTTEDAPGPGAAGIGAGAERADAMCTYGTEGEAAVVVLSTPPAATTARLNAILRRWRPREALGRLLSEDQELYSALLTDGCRISRTAFSDWARASGSLSLSAAGDRLRVLGQRVWWRRVEDATECRAADDECRAGLCVVERLFTDDDDPPPVLFMQGDPSALNHPRVAIVGTRNATSLGREVARMLGRALSDRGVAVVSGLALGIDAASHAGALASADAQPVGVVGSGLDVVYPPANRRLWRAVGERGLLLSEVPPGRGPTPATFPARNRIIAQLAQVIVVVESAATGGSLITVDRALERGRHVLAVPGNPLNPASAGTNELLRPGLLGPVALPCLSVADVLTLLELEVVSNAEYTDGRSQPTGAEETVLNGLGWDELSVGGLAARLSKADSALTLAELSLALARLEDAGWVIRSAGRWHRVGVSRP
jgi:DNA processing protein